MKLAKKIAKGAGFLLLIPVLYFLISLILSAITVNRVEENPIVENTIYLHTNGIHLDIVIPKNNIDSLLLKGLKHNPTDQYFSFGWGEENFYINTPTWGDLTFKNAFTAILINSPSLMHVTKYDFKQTDWTEIKVTNTELQKMNRYLLHSFQTNENGNKILLEDQGYTAIDDFYKANGSYSCLNTCNSWVNTGFKDSGLQSCLWTPFDFGLLNKYD